MQYLSGGGFSAIVGSEFGAMITPSIRNTLPLHSMTWGADTGLFSAKGVRSFDFDVYREWLRSRSEFRATNVFATAPDVVGNWAATLAKSLPVLDAIRAEGYAVALVTQDGLRVSEIPWSDIDCLFIGGTDRHKTSYEVKLAIRLALKQGKHVHCGRVNGFRRFAYFYDLGAHTVDGTFVAFGPKQNIERLRKWYQLLALPRSIHSRSGSSQLSIFSASS